MHAAYNKVDTTISSRTIVWYKISAKKYHPLQGFDNKRDERDKEL
jgi:hypothetical protein